MKDSLRDLGVCELKSVSNFVYVFVTEKSSQYLLVLVCTI